MTSILTNQIKTIRRIFIHTQFIAWVLQTIFNIRKKKRNCVLSACELCAVCEGKKNFSLKQTYRKGSYAVLVVKPDQNNKSIKHIEKIKYIHESRRKSVLSFVLTQQSENHKKCNIYNRIGKFINRGTIKKKTTTL